MGRQVTSRPILVPGCNMLAVIEGLVSGMENGLVALSFVVIVFGPPMWLIGLVVMWFIEWCLKERPATDRR